MSEAEIRVLALAAEWQREIDSIKGPRWDRRTSGGKRGSIMERCLTELRAALAAPSVEEGPRPKCDGCGQEIDPDVCGCGSSRQGHGWGDGHSFIPMGCDCMRVRPAPSPEAAASSHEGGGGMGSSWLKDPPPKKKKRTPEAPARCPECGGRGECGCSYGHACPSCGGGTGTKGGGKP